MLCVKRVNRNSKMVNFSINSVSTFEIQDDHMKIEDWRFYNVFSFCATSHVLNWSIDLYVPSFALQTNHFHLLLYACCVRELIFYAHFVSSLIWSFIIVENWNTPSLSHPIHHLLKIKRNTKTIFLFEINGSIG